MRFLPNILTIFRIFLTPFFVFCLLQDAWQRYAIVIFVTASLTDWYDGYLARKYKYDSDWGTFLDPLADKILVLSAFFTFAYLGVVKLWMVIVIVSRDLLVTTLRSLAMRQGKPMITSLFAKIKTASQMLMILLLLVLIAMQSLVVHNSPQPNGRLVSALVAFDDWNIVYSGMLVVTLLTAFSGVFYVYQNRQTLRYLGDFMSIKDL